MVYVVEVRCDTPPDCVPTDGGLCDRQSGRSPSVDSMGIRKAIAEATANARGEGYRYDRLYGWQCPACQKRRTYRVAPGARPV